MAVNSVNGSYYQTGQTTASTSTGSMDGLGEQDFLQLLVTQLKNQDPMDPLDANQFVGQLAQFSTLEQLINLDSDMQSLLQAQQLTEAAGMIGKNVTLSDTNNQTVSGPVEKALVSGSSVQVVVNGNAYDLSAVQEVG